MAEIYVIRIDYELPNKPDFKWVANVAAYNEDEAVDYLRKNLGNIKINMIERKTRLDAISNEVEQVIFKSFEKIYQSANKPGKPGKAKEEKIEEKTPKKKINFKKDKK